MGMSDDFFRVKKKDKSQPVVVQKNPCIKDLGEMAENFRSKERSRDLPAGPLDPEGLVQQVFREIVAVPVSLPLFPDVDHSTAGDSPDKG